MRMITVLIVGFLGAVACPADTIVDGSSLNESELLSLGFDPSGFLFTGNTMYDYNGIDELTIIEADINPLNTTTLAGVPTVSATVIIADQDTGDSVLPGESNSALDTPEPATAGLMALAAAAGFTLLFKRARAPQRLPAKVRA